MLETKMGNSHQLTTSIGDFLRQKRNNKKLKQGDVARNAGLDPSVICRYEANKIRPTLENVDRLVEAYQLTEKEERQFRTIINSRGLAYGKMPDEIRVLSHLLMLPKEVRERVIKAAIAYDSLK